MDMTEPEVAEAEHRMETVRQAGYATAARYDPATSSIVVTLHTGVTFIFPTRIAEGLAGESAEDLAEIEISPAGLGLHWPRLDADLYLPGLLQGVFGTRKWMAAQLGAAGGSRKSPAKTASARKNGRKGGRPRKAEQK